MPTSLREIDREIIRCSVNSAYMVYNYVRIRDEAAGTLVPFLLWPAQAEILKRLGLHQFICLLKARQIGMTTIVLGYLVHLATFKPSRILLFSKGLVEAKDLIRRIKSMIESLPEWLQPKQFTVDHSQELALSNGSSFEAFASRSSGGDSRTASCVVLDEADLIPNMDLVLQGALPTIGDGGQLILLSRTDKANPESAFKRVYRGAPKNGYFASFLPWWSRPGRTKAWYESVKAEIFSRTGGLDDLWAQYPETAEQALAPAQLTKRLPIGWLESCYDKRDPIELPEGAPTFPGLCVYKPPEPGRRYIIGGDPAEGGLDSCDSAAVVMDRATYEEVASIAAKADPSVFGSMLDAVGTYYNKADLLVERNNHGHAVLLWLQDNSSLTLLQGHDAILVGDPGYASNMKVGWLSNSKGKALMYSAAADVLREGSAVIHSSKLFHQLASIESSTLKPPPGQASDLAVAFCLCTWAAAEAPGMDGVILIDGAGPEPGKEPPKPRDPNDQSWLFEDSIWEQRPQY